MKNFFFYMATYLYLLNKEEAVINIRLYFFLQYYFKFTRLIELIYKKKKNVFLL
jgi:hypothetical protein